MIDAESGVSIEALQVEIEYEKIVEAYVASELSEGEANDKLKKLVDNAHSDKILSDKDMDSYIHRRDPKGYTRTPVNFAMTMRNTHKNEKATMKYFCKWVEKRGESVRYESLGSDEEGYVLLSNVRSRTKSPYEPDYNMWIGGKELKLEIKNFGEEIWLKVYSLKKYKNRKSYMTVGFKGLYYLFKKKAIDYMLENTSPPYQTRYGKEAIIISISGKNADFSLKTMVDDGLVKWI